MRRSAVYRLRGMVRATPSSTTRLALSGWSCPKGTDEGRPSRPQRLPGGTDAALVDDDDARGITSVCGA